MPIHANHWSGGAYHVLVTANGMVNGHVNRGSMTGIHDMVALRNVNHHVVVDEMVVAVNHHRHVGQSKAVPLVVENALGTNPPSGQVRYNDGIVEVSTRAFDHRQNWRMARLQQ